MTPAEHISADIERSSKLTVLQHIEPKDIVVIDDFVRVGDRTYKRVICVLGGGPGLEALHAAARNPDAAIVVIDPLTDFADQIFGYLAGRAAKNQNETARGLASILVNDKSTNGLIEFNPTDSASQRIAQAFAAYAPDFSDLNARVYWINQAYEDVTDHIPPQCFSQVLWLFPYARDCFLSRISQFCHRVLQNEGELRCMTDTSYYAQQLAKVFTGEAYTVSRPVSGDVNDGYSEHPASVYDATLSSRKQPGLAILRAPIKSLNPFVAGMYGAIYWEKRLKLADQFKDLFARLNVGERRSSVITAKQAFERIFGANPTTT